MKPPHKHLLLVIICLFLAACSGSKDKPQSTAELYFQKGEKQFESKLYDDAIASWEKVRDTFYSPKLSMLAELKIAETYYVAKRYDEAASAFSHFLEQHPNDPRAASIYYRMGLSHYQQILTPDRDQTTTQKALDSFTKLIELFPNDSRVQEAKDQIQRCRTRLAEHEVYVGKFYLKKKRYQAAINRLEGILESFPDYFYRDEAYFYLGKTYILVKDTPKALVIYNKLATEFPNSDFLEKAHKLLEKNELDLAQKDHGQLPGEK